MKVYGGCIRGRSRGVYMVIADNIALQQRYLRRAPQLTPDSGRDLMKAIELLLRRV